MAMSHEEAANNFASDIATLVDRVPAYYGLPREMFSIVCASSDLKTDINDRVRQEIDAVEQGYNDVVLSDREDTHRRDMGEITQSEYEELDRERGMLAEEVARRDYDMKQTIYSQLDQKLPGVLDEDVLLSLHPELADDELQSEYIADTEQQIRDSLYNTDTYFILADGAEQLDRATRHLRQCERACDNASPEDLDDAYDALSNAQYDQRSIANELAPVAYVFEAYEQHRSGQEVTPLSSDAIGDKTQELIDKANQEGFGGLMEYIDQHVFYEMSLPNQLGVVSERFKRNEAINADLVDYCVNTSMQEFAETRDVVANEYDDKKSLASFRADIEAAKDFKATYPTSNVITEQMIGAMEMAYKTDGKSVGYSPSSQRESVNRELVSSDGFPDFSIEEANSNYDNPDAQRRMADMADTEKTQAQKEVEAFAQKQYRQMRDEQTPVFTSNAEHEAYCNKRFAQEVSKFDANYFKVMTSGDEAPLSTARLASAKQMEREATKLRASIAGTGTSRAMWLGMMCLTPMLREGLTLDSVATLGGMVTVMAIGALVTMPDKVAKMRNKHEINKEINQLNRRAKAKEYDQWCRKAERKLAAGESIAFGIRGETGAKLLDAVRHRRDSAARRADVRVGMTEESVGIVGVGILVSANKQMREHPDQIPTANRVYQENMATLYRMAAEDGMTRETVQAAIGKAYARVVDGIIQMEGEDCYNNPTSAIHDFATGNGVKPPEMQVSSVERGGKEFVVAHKDGYVPYAKVAHTMAEYEFIDDIKPFVVPNTQQTVGAVGAIIKDAGKGFDKMDVEAKLRKCPIGQVRSEHFETFDFYIESALDGRVNPFTDDTNKLAGALYSYERIPDESKDDSALYDAMGHAYIDVCKNNVMSLAEYNERVLKILTNFQSDMSEAALQCSNISELEHMRKQIADVAYVVKDGIAPQYVEENPFMETAQSLYDLQKEAARAFEINTLSGVSGGDVITAEEFVHKSEALYTTFNDMDSYSLWPKEVKDLVIQACDEGMKTSGNTPEMHMYYQEMKQAASTPFVPLYQQFNGVEQMLQYDMAAGGYSIESDGDRVYMHGHISSQRPDGALLYNKFQLSTPLPESRVLDRLGVNRVVSISSPQYSAEGPTMVSNSGPKQQRNDNSSYDVPNNDNARSYDVNMGYRADDSASADIIDVDAGAEAPVSVDLSLVEASKNNEAGKDSDDMEMGD